MARTSGQGLADAPRAAAVSDFRRGTWRAGHADIAFGIALVIAVGSITLLPVLFVVAESFNVAGAGQSFRPGLGAWSDVFSSAKTLKAIGYSFLLSVRIPIAIAVAFVIAWLLVRVRIPGAGFIEHALWFGFFLPILPVAMGWTLLLDAQYGLVNDALRFLLPIQGPVFSINSVSGIIWVHLSLSTVPVMVILLAPALRQLDSSVEEAADMSGASVLTTLHRITIPLIAPAILTAFVAGFIRSLEVFEVEQLLGTPVGIFVYATRIYDLISADPPLYSQAMALSALFLAILLVAAFAYQHYIGRLSSRATLTGRGTRLQPRLRGRWAWAASAIVMLYIFVSIGLPLIVLLAGSLSRLFGFFFIEQPWTLDHWRQVFASPAVADATMNSLVIGLASGICGTLLYALIAWILVRTRVWGRSAVTLLVWLPWAIPGLVLGFTLSSMLLNIPLLSGIYGTAVPLVAAMIIKNMPLGVHMLRTSILQLSNELEEAALMSGASFARTFLRITVPLIAPMCVSVFLLVFIASLSDISASVLLATPGSRTLALVMFEFATSSRPESAAVIGVLIAALSLLVTSAVFYFWMRRSGAR
ncbi:MAG: iron ABC transporter permease [Betaproteobacteria bacterium]|nr:iron ABC transporter permease [Betaproteobacteria bacterium]